MLCHTPITSFITRTFLQRGSVRNDPTKNLVKKPGKTVWRLPNARKMGTPTSSGLNAAPICILGRSAKRVLTGPGAALIAITELTV
ncbi:MAG: hypothetical protein AAFZ63_21690 [Bacteroidota bacterium]